MSPDQEDRRRRGPSEHTSPDDALDYALDELLRAARWPEPEPDQLPRLERRWTGLWHARVRRRRAASVLGLVAIGAGLLIAASLWMDIARAPKEPREIAPAVPQSEPRVPQSEPREPPAKQVAESADRPKRPEPLDNPRDAPAPDQIPPSPPDDTRDSEPEAPLVPAKTLVRSRPATPYEKLAFRLSTRRRSAARQQPDRELVEAAIERRVREPHADLDALAQPLLASRGPNESALLAWARRSRGAPQVAAIDLLGRVGTPRSVPVLAGLVGAPETHAAAVRALARLADLETLVRLADAELDPHLRQELMASLLSRGDAAAVAAYLDFVQRRETRASALAALDRVAEPPVALLFEFLKSPRQTQRLAAAVALGQIDGPDVSRRLIDMVLSDVPCHEALVALVASPGQEPSRFVSQARSHPLLAGSVRSIEHRLRVFLPYPGGN
jgi:hypothetical protein